MGGEKRIKASSVRKNQVFIERRFQRSRIGGTQDGVRLLNVVSDSKAGLSLSGHGESVVEIAADAQVECPVPYADRILNVKRHFLHVGVPVEAKGNSGLRGTTCGW